MISILAMITVQMLDMTLANMARKHEWVIVLMYLNCLLPLLIAFGLLYKTPVFHKKQLKESFDEV